MANRFIRLALAILSLILLFGSTPLRAGAQASSQAWLTPPETQAFPVISTYLAARDSQGNFPSNLTPAEVGVLEDGISLPVGELRQIHPGALLVVAINPGPALAIRDSQGLNRGDRLVQALTSWAQVRSGSSLDDLKLLTSDAPLDQPLPSLEDWAAALKAYQPDYRNAVPNYDILQSALAAAAGQTSRTGMGRAVLFITALPQEETGIGLQSLAARAGLLGIRVFVWLVGSPVEFNSQKAAPLKDLASQTGGGFFGYSGVEDIPDPETFLEPLRSAYSLTYTSGIHAAGAHRLAVQIRTADGEITTSEQEFDLRLLPPNIAFISPQLEIKRNLQAVETSAATPGQAEILQPASQDLEVLIEFPDGYPRPLTRTTLYVDGAIAAENTAEPFDRFTWDLTGYTTSGNHVLKAEALDSQGLSSTSIDLNVAVKVESPQRNVLGGFNQGRQLLVGLVVLLAGAVLLLVLIVGGRLQPGSLRAYRMKNRPSRQALRKDPLTQPVPLKTEADQRMPGWINRLHWPQRRFTPKASAYLVPFTENEQEASTPPISVSGNEITFGSDPTQATQVLEDPSVDALHARLRQQEDGTFRLSDEGSTAGTWVNYTPISSEGMQLEHGDLIHIGRAGFRFVVREPERTRKPVITPEERPE